MHDYAGQLARALVAQVAEREEERWLGHSEMVLQAEQAKQQQSILAKHVERDRADAKAASNAKVGCSLSLNYSLL